MLLRINDTAPGFVANTTHGPIDFHQWLGDQWAVPFSLPNPGGWTAPKPYLRIVKQPG